ncbi:uncharacterized protein LOC126788303 [Argentina anserina]|uniref:uncharacterized protein LOC126788303 n=1 Tax=Argentina anserina TaxID=57926 RepID=UPI00217676D3|nr:uncharacterized protein LOC126788303 [Potentilla anserina]XP_050370239.1 uncharacterized protein LOC126788303 [Potentilla anserina]XP_050370240.1 uncharacterized protein LOC126788303 [Potentilla anserina]
MSPTRPAQVARKSTGGKFPKKRLATRTKPGKKPARPPQVDDPGISVMAPPPQPETQATVSTGGVVCPVNLRAQLSQHCASVDTYIGWSEATIQNLKKELDLALKEKDLVAKERDLAFKEKDLTLKEMKDVQKDLSECQSELEQSQKSLEQCKKQIEVEKRKLSEELMQDFQEQVFMTESQQYTVGYSDCSKGRRHRLGWTSEQVEVFADQLYFSDMEKEGD